MWTMRSELVELTGRWNHFLCFSGVPFKPNGSGNQAGGEHGSAPHQDPVQGSRQRRRWAAEANRAESVNTVPKLTVWHTSYWQGDFRRLQGDAAAQNSTMQHLTPTLEVPYNARLSSTSVSCLYLTSPNLVAFELRDVMGISLLVTSLFLTYFFFRQASTPTSSTRPFTTSKPTFSSRTMK